MKIQADAAVEIVEYTGDRAGMGEIVFQREASRWKPMLAGILLAAVIFVSDLYLGSSLPFELLYIPVVLIAFRSPVAGDIYFLTLIISFLCAGLFFIERPVGGGAVFQYSPLLVCGILWPVAMACRSVKEKSHLQNAILESAGEGIISLDRDLCIRSFNSAAERIFGMPRGQARGEEFENLLQADDRGRFLSIAQDLVEQSAAGRCGTLEVTGTRADGRDVPISLTMRAAAGRGTLAFTVLARDVTDLRKAESRLRKLSNAVEQSSAATIITDPHGIIEYVNRRFSDISGYEPGDVIGHNVRMLRSSSPQGNPGAGIWKTINAGGEWRGEFHNRKKNGDFYWVEAAISPIREGEQTTHFLCVQEDISIRKEFEERLLRQANFDELTGLPNRLLALDRLKHALKVRQQEEKHVGVMIIDLDQFNEVNDTLGHQVGDMLIKATAQRVQHVLRQSDTLARLGGDEFLIILPHLLSAKTADQIAATVLEEIDKPFRIDGKEIYVTASIGISVSPDDGLDAHSLMKNSDSALFLAKKEGRNTYRFFKSHMNEEALARLNMISKLRRAVAKEEFSLNYQPLVDIASGEIVAMEALVRWNHPEEGFIPPDRFIPVAEETGLIKEIGDWVLRRACIDLKELMRQARRPLKVAVNISARQFKDCIFDHRVMDILNEAGLAADFLELELTERLLMMDDPETAGILKRLSEAGVSLSIDDFGTGYSSLSYLKRYPFDVLKIDRAFINDVIGDEQNAALVSAIIAMAQSLDLKVIAEGVEDAEQLEFLAGLNCDIGQGYYFSRPVSFDEMASKLVAGAA